MMQTSNSHSSLTLRERIPLSTPEGLFFLIWAIAILIASFISAFASFRFGVSLKSPIWLTIPFLGTTASLFLIRWSRKNNRTLFGEANRMIAGTWMFVGPSIGLTSSLVPEVHSAMTMQLLLVGIGVGVCSRITQWKPFTVIGVAVVVASILYARLTLPDYAMALIFGAVGFLGMGVPAFMMFRGVSRASVPLSQEVTQEP